MNTESDFTHLPPNDREALNDLLNRVQKTMSLLRADRRRLAKENDELRERLLAQPQALPNEPTLVDTISKTIGVASGEVRRAMGAGGVIHDGNPLTDTTELAKHYRGQTIAYGRRGTPVKIEGDVNA